MTLIFEKKVDCSEFIGSNGNSFLKRNSKLIILAYLYILNIKNNQENLPTNKRSL